MNKKILVALVAAGLLYAGCGKLFNGKIPEETFIAYYIDLVAAQDTLGRDPAATAKIIESLNTKYGVTKVRYEKTLQYYSEGPERWEAFFDKVTAVIHERQKKG